MTKDKIKAIGNFLSSYESDLIYISNFQKYKQGLIDEDSYLNNSPGTFYKFLVDYKVIRNLKKGSAKEVLLATTRWSASHHVDNVDRFAKELSRLSFTHDQKLMTSLASKILFLNNPWRIIPMDIRAKRSLVYRANNYSEYTERVTHYLANNRLLIAECLKGIQVYCQVIERETSHDLANIKTIRRNRFVDKLLWTGK
jgi:hypothetical protein